MSQARIVIAATLLLSSCFFGDAVTPPSGVSPELASGILSAGSLAAQAPTAAVTGLVRDSTTRPLSGVQVQATDLATGYVYRAVSEMDGRYWLRGLPPGRYELTADRIGLRGTTVRQELHVGRTSEIHFTLSQAAVELEPIRVEVAGPLVETTRSEISFAVDGTRIDQLPEESRHFMDLAQLVPGATRGTRDTGGPPQFATSGSSVGALNRGSLGVLVDGADFTEGLFGDLGGSLPLLAIREFEVIQSQYSADLGRAASGVVNIVTRRGSNESRARAFALFRHRSLNARGAFEDEKPDFERWHWGVSASGPITVDRTHVFLAFERRAQNAFSTVTTGGAFPEYEGTFRTPFTDNLIFARLDHRMSDAHQLTLRYSGELGSRLLGVGGIRAPEYGQHNTLDLHSGLLTHRWTGGDAWLNEARLHVMNQRREQLRSASDGPTFVYPDLVRGPHQAEERSRSLRVELRDDLSTLVTGPAGTHRLRWGAHLSWLHTEASSSFYENGLFRFAENTDTLPAFAQVSFRDPAVSLDASNMQIAFYVQDEWSPAPALTLELGLRYDLETNGTNQDYVSPFAGQLPFVLTSPRPIDTDNVAPRIGIAWDPWSDGGTVVRGGFGIFYDAQVAGPLLALERSSGVPLAQIRNPGTTDVGALEINPDTVPPIVWASAEIETPMTRQFSAGVEHLFPGGLIVRLDGLYIQGRNLLLQRNVNPLGADGRRFPEFSRTTLLESEGRAQARMLLLRLSKTFRRGWIDFGYTLADRRNTNDTWGGPLVPQTDPDRLDIDREWGPAAWDERHRLVATAGIDLPGGMTLVAKTVYASGRPFTAVVAGDPNGDQDFANDRPAGEERNARRGPDYFRTDLGLTWMGPFPTGARPSLLVNVYNVFNRTIGVPESVQGVLESPLFGQPTAAFPPRQIEVGIRISAR